MAFGQPKQAVRSFTNLAVLACTAAAAAMVSGCSGGDSPSPGPQLGLACVDDSSHCITQRAKSLDGLMADKSRSWVKQPATPEAYASGVRLFALSKRRKELTCDELASGRREAEAGPGILRANNGRLTPAQVSRGAMLSSEVARELSREHDRRCRKT